MCGIVGYTGHQQAQNILLNCLARLEYRGYDSCGIALAGSGISVYKDAVRVSELKRSSPHLMGTTGIGHTRWATHGSPCQINAHPHTDCTGHFAVVHNGVISNYLELKKRLIQEGHNFISETDTEVIPHLLERYYTGNMELAFTKTLDDLKGSYAIIAMAEDQPGLYFARQDSPLILGIGDNEQFAASDVTALLEYTDRVIYLENGDSGYISPQRIRINQNGQEIEREIQKVIWSAEQSQKHGYEHFMLKEIHEQPHVLRNTLSDYLSGIKSPFSFRNEYGKPDSLLMLACGTSFHSALIGKYIGERLTDISIKAELASELNYYQNLQHVPVAVGITQSGETADTLKAMRRLKEDGSKVVAITNVPGSTASRIADYTMYLNAGPEISVAATKSFTAQLTALYYLSLMYSRIEARTYNDLIMDMRMLPDQIQRLFTLEDLIASSSYKLADYEYVIFIGRGINYAIAMEGALKLKEVSYIHSEAYAAGEIKHGPFALLSRDTPVVAIIANDSSYDAMLTNIKEIKSRGSPVFAIVDEKDDIIQDIADYVIPVPSTSDLTSPFVNAVVIQLIAYYSAKKRLCPIDFPRNLAKSVTVE